MHSTLSVRLRFVLAGIGLFILTPVLLADPVFDVVRVVPQETSLGLLVRDLRGHYDPITNGPLATAFRATKIGQSVIAAPELKQIDQFANQLSTVLGTDLSKIRDEVFGDAVVFAYRNADPGRGIPESGLLITYTRDPKLAAQMLERLNEAQIKSGELKSVEPIKYAGITYAGKTYFRRVKQDGKGPDEFYYQDQRRSILAFSHQDAAIRSLLHRAEEDVAPPSRAVFMASHEAKKAFATMWLNPRSFDAELAAKLKTAEQPGEAAFLQSFERVWKATDGFVLSVHLEKHLELSLSVSARWDELPPAFRRFGNALREPSALARLFPPDALLTITNRTDFAAALDILTEFLSPDARQSLKGSLEQSVGSVFGKNNLPLLPDHLGPDWGICVTAPLADSKAVLPEIMAAIRVRPGKEKGSVEQSILDAMDTVATLARTAYNQTHADSLTRMKTRFGEAEVTYLTGGGLPVGLQPAYGMKDGFLFVATSPAAIGRLTAAKNAPVDDRIVAISFRNIDRYLKDRGDGLKLFLAAQNKISPEEAGKQIEQFRDGMELLDRLELVNESKEPGQAKLTLRLYFTASLRK